MQSLNVRIAGYTSFQKSTLLKHTTRFPTPFSFVDFLFMAFGLKNAAQALKDLKDFSFLDDDGVMMAPCSEEPHQETFPHGQGFSCPTAVSTPTAAMASKQPPGPSSTRPLRPPGFQHRDLGESPVEELS